jgi:hypothetical protein
MPLAGLPRDLRLSLIRSGEASRARCQGLLARDDRHLDLMLHREKQKDGHQSDSGENNRSYFGNRHDQGSVRFS